MLDSTWRVFSRKPKGNRVCRPERVLPVNAAVRKNELDGLLHCSAGAADRENKSGVVRISLAGRCSCAWTSPLRARPFPASRRLRAHQAQRKRRQRLLVIDPVRPAPAPAGRRRYVSGRSSRSSTPLSTTCEMIPEIRIPASKQASVMKSRLLPVLSAASATTKIPAR